MTTTYTTSHTSTFSEARARAVMRHVLADFMNVASAALIGRETIQRWHEELEYAVLHEVVEAFQLQLTRPDGTRLGLCYTVRDDGTILEASKAGGVDFHGLPAGTRVGLHVSYRLGAPNLPKVSAYLQSKGWTTGGSAIDGASSRDRAYSKDGFGIMRAKVGNWT